MADGGAYWRLAIFHMKAADDAHVPHLASLLAPPGRRKPAPDHDQRAQLRAGSRRRVRGPAFPGVGRQGGVWGAGRDEHDTSLEGVAMTSIESVTLEVPDPVAREAFYTAAFGLGGKVRLRASQAPTTGFRGFMLSLVVSQPGTVDSLIGTALAGGAMILKPAGKGFWGYGGVVQDPGGAIWKVATSSKKDTGPATREVDDLVLLLGAENVKVARQFYLDRGLAVAKSFGSKYVEFDTPSSPVRLALYSRRAAAKDAGVSPDGTGSHRIVIGSDAGPFTDPDGFAWEAAPL